VVALALLFAPCAAIAQTEPVLTGIGADTVLTFAHASVPGATGIDFRFTGASHRPTPPPKAISW